MELLTGRKRSMALFLLCLGQLMCILDISIVNIAIPSIQRELNLDTATLQWLITAYVLTYGGFLLVGGRVGDLYGRRRMLLIGLAGFTVASALGGLSQSASMLLISRAGQGLGGAIITPTVMSYIASLYKEGPGRNRALGLLGAVTGAGFALGLVLGGLLTSTVGWRWVFFINLPIGIFVFVLATILLPETPKGGQAVNIPGAILATAGLGLAVYTLSTNDASELFSWRTLFLAILAATFLTLFVRLERRSEQPLVPSGLLSQGSLAKAVIGSATFGSVVGSSSLLLTLYLQNVSQLSPLHTGLAFLPQEVTVFFGATLAGRLVSRYGTRNVLMTGMVFFSVSMFTFSLINSTHDYMSVVLPGFLLLGFGIGTVNVAGSIAATEGLPQRVHGISTGIWNTGTQLGTAFGLAILNAVAAGRTNALLRSVPNVSSETAIVNGYKYAFLVGVGFALLGIIGLYAVHRREQRGAHDGVGQEQLG